MKRKSLGLWFLVFMFFGLLAIPVQALEYSFIDLGTLGGTESYATGINSSGQVVGYSNLMGSPDYHGFLYSNDVMLDLWTVGGTLGYTWGINDNGQVVGDSSGHAFLYHNGVMQDLGTLGNRDSWAAGINDNGQVVGSSHTVAPTYHAFLYSGGMRDLVLCHN